MSDKSININIGKLGAIATLIVTIGGAGWATYQTVDKYLGTLATKVEVEQSEILGACSGQRRRGAARTACRHAGTGRPGRPARLGRHGGCPCR